jgi:hypothetical protein
MTNLSPQAQAIIDAFYCELRIDYEHVGIAAALRVLADNVAPENYRSFYEDKKYDTGMEDCNDSIREAILSIATELEAL